MAPFRTCTVFRELRDPMTFTSTFLDRALPTWVRGATLVLHQRGGRRQALQPPLSGHRHILLG